MIYYKLIFILLLISLPALSQNKHAILVGISDYHCLDKNNEWNDINGVNDVMLVSPILKKFGYNVNTITDSEATYDNIVNSIKRLTAKCKKGDYVYLHFSCHGQPFEDTNGDEKDGWDESIVPIDAGMIYEKGLYEGDKHIIDDDLLIMMNNIRSKIGESGVVYVVLDACHAGTSFRGDDDKVVRGTNYGFSIEGKYYRPSRVEKLNHYRMESITGYSPIIYLEACRPYQKNVEIVEDGKNYGGLTYYISKVLPKFGLNNNHEWIYKVDLLMKNDIRLSNQNMVIEISQ